jgi:hypothetical protein
MVSGRGSRERVGSDHDHAWKTEKRSGQKAHDSMDSRLLEVSIEKIAAARNHHLTGELQTRFYVLNILCCACHFFILLLCASVYFKRGSTVFDTAAYFAPRFYPLPHSLEYCPFPANCIPKAIFLQGIFLTLFRYFDDKTSSGHFPSPRRFETDMAHLPHAWPTYSPSTLPQALMLAFGDSFSMPSGY